MTTKIKPKAKPHYVNNKEFSLSVVEYVKTVIEAKASESTIPKVPDYVATCFMKISEGLSHRPNFVRYTYREEMVMDGVENCLRAINNYKIETATRTGNPNAFSYFTQICFFAFIRRFAAMGMDDNGAAQTLEYVDTLRQRIDQIRTKDARIKEFAKIEKEKEKLELFMV